ncbi:MAG: DNA primase [Candidatus Kerfeldbacteria bacterium]|nr:DNA primase [Candidatus Kerfeldbacteria bacterium]
MADAVIDQIKQRLDLVEFAQEYLRLTKAGTNWRALCPFHNEKSPSFMVSQDKQIWHCFGCGKGGDIFTFLQEIDGLAFPEALKILAQRAGVTLEHYQPDWRNQKTSLLDIVAAAQRYYHQQLLHDPLAVVAQQYLQHRGISTDAIVSFGLGYSHDRWDDVLVHLRQQGYSEADIFAAGLSIKRDQGGYYDRFRARVMIPLYSVNGLVVGFTARSLRANEPAGKYINSPQSTLYDKSSMVYGLHRAKTSIKKLNAAIVVEGNFDVITAHYAGFPNVVAISGTAFTTAQLKLLQRYSKNILLALDMDQAGRQATERSIMAALALGFNIRVIELPNQFKDPDECIRQQPEVFKQAIRQAQHIIDYYFHRFVRTLDLTKVEHKKRAVQALVPILAYLTDPVERDHFVQRLAEMIQVDANSIRQQLTTPVRARLEPGVTTQVRPSLPDRYYGLAQQTVALVLQLPDQLGYCRDYLDPAFLLDDGSRELYNRMISYYNTAGVFIESDYVAHYPEDEPLLTTFHLLVQHDFPEANLAQLQSHLVNNIRALHKGYIQRRSLSLEAELKHAEQAAQPDTVTSLLQELQLLNQQLTDLER